MSKIKNIDKDNQQMEDRLKSFTGNKNPFQVPEGYFDGLPDKMIQAVRENNSRKRSFLQILPGYVRYAAAAAIIIMVSWSLIYLFNHVNVQSEDTLTFTPKEIYQYNFNNLAQLEEEYLLSLMETESLEGLSISSIEDTDLSDDDIIYYLLSENHIEYHAITGY